MLDATLSALAHLRAQEAGPLGQGLGSANAQACMHQAIRPLNQDSLRAAVEQARPLPSSIAIVVPYGVFTTPIEWTAIAVAGGASVHLKAPQRDPELVRRLAEVFQKEGLPVTWSTDRTLPSVDAVLAFGSDESVADIQRDHPHTTVVPYGHKFSIALVTGNPTVAARCLAMDLVRYDGRGCMAPAAIFCDGDAMELGLQLSLALDHAQGQWPRGEVDAGLGPEWRRRLGLARVLGRVWSSSDWAVTVAPPAHFAPSALPRMANVYPVRDREELARLLEPWSSWLSSLGTDGADPKLSGVHRVCRLGWMQAPMIPRNHDGRSMLGGLHSENGED